MAKKTKKAEKDFKGLLNKKIENKSLTVGIIGLGYVGLPLAVEYAKKGFKTIGFDLDQKKLNMLAKGKNYIEDLKDEWIKEIRKNDTFIATDDFKQLKKCQAIFICVPTPFTVNKDPDISYIIDFFFCSAGSDQYGRFIPS